MPKLTKTSTNKRLIPQRNERNKPDPDVVSVAIDGDAILNVKDEVGEDQIKIRVRTSRLRAASTVFDALFSPRFAEGQHLDSQNPPEISLVDDPVSMEIICQILHSQTNDLPSSLAAMQVLTLARTVDKYDLSAAMSSASFIPLTLDGNHEDLILLLEAAILLRSKAALKGVSRALILDGATPFVNVRDRSLDVNLLSLLYVLEHERSKIRTYIGSIVFGQASQNGGNCDCRWTEKYNERVLELANDNGLNPHMINSTTVTETIVRLKTTVDDIISYKIDTTGCPYEFHPTPSDLHSILYFHYKDMLRFKDLEPTLDGLWEDLIR